MVCGDWRAAEEQKGWLIVGLFDRIFGSKQKISSSTEYKALTAYQPAFTNYNGQIYESELVRAAINARATHISKLSVKFNGHGSEYLAKRLKSPNAFNTWSQFLYRLATILDCANTAFIVPTFDKFNRVIELYPVMPSRCKMVDLKGEPWLAFEFRDGHHAQLPVWKVGVMTKFQYKDDFFGSSNRAMDNTLALVDIQNQGIKEAVKSSATYRFMAQLDNFSLNEDRAKEQERFSKSAFGADSTGGMLLFPNTYKNIQQIKSTPFVADAEQMAIIRQNVFDYFGVNADVLENKAYGDAWTAFYEGAIEPFAIQFSEVMTNLFIMCDELTGDASVMATANRLQYMSNAEKLNVSSQLADRGVLNRDEVREIWNLPPLPDGQGKEYVIRGEYKNANEQIDGGASDADQGGT